MNKNKSNNLKGIVVALKANFLIVEIDLVGEILDRTFEKTRLLCTRRNRLDYHGLFIDVGDIVYTTENQKPFDKYFGVNLYHVINEDTKKQIIVSEDNIERIKF